MGILQKYLDSLRERKAKIKEVQESIDIPARVMERKKNANEREYERYLEEERQRHIEKELERFRAKKQHEIFHTNVVTGDKNLFNGKNIFKEKKGGCMLKWR